MSDLPTSEQLLAPTKQDLVSVYLNAYKNQAKALGKTVDTTPGTLPWVKANALADLVGLISYKQQLSIDRGKVDNMTAPQLDELIDELGLPVKYPSQASGSLIISVTPGITTTIPDQFEFQLPGGALGRVSGNHFNVKDGYQVAVLTVDTGAQANVAGGTKVKWSTPLPNVNVAAVVASGGLTGATSEETIDAKRARIKDAQRNPAGGENWANVVRVVENASTAIAKAFSYPALGGPASSKVAIQKGFDYVLNNYSKQCDSVTVEKARLALVREFPSMVERITQSVVDQPTNIAFKLTLSDPQVSGVPDVGWKNTTRYPSPGGTGRASPSVVTNASQISILKSDSLTSPTAGVTRIMWFNGTTKSFIEALVTVVGDGGTNWNLTLSVPFSDGVTTVATGDYISPACHNASKYRDALLKLIDQLGPGENTTDPAVVSQSLNRGKRRPATTDSNPSDFDNAFLMSLQSQFDEVETADYHYRQFTSPTVPGAKATAPNALTLNKLAFYAG